MSYINRLKIFPEKERQALDLMFKDIYFGIMRSHTHASGTTGGQLDWDDVWSDAVHTHASDAEGGTLDHGAALTGLTDDDHTQYLLIDGSRAMTGDLKLATTQKVTFDSDGDSDVYVYESSEDSLDVVIGGTFGFGLRATALGIPATNKFFVDGANCIGDTFFTESAANTFSIYANNLKIASFSAAGGNGGVDLYDSYLALPATKKLYLDGGGNTYITESSGDVIQIYTNGNLRCEINASGAIKFPSLAGAGSRTVVADANGTITAP